MITVITRWNCLRDRDWQMVRYFWWPLFRPVTAFTQWLRWRCPRCGGRFNWFTPQRWCDYEDSGGRAYHPACAAAKDREERGW